ncbi:MAG: citrate (Si)-synthase [Anaerolineales bacterium]|nr:citrate (Si)-synthase [Anaerolineales bacterium]
MILKEKLSAQIPAWRERVKKLLAESGNIKVGEVTISQVYGGMRDVKSLVTDISYVDPEEGIRLRGFTIPEVLEKLPKLPGAEMPLVGGLYYLLLVGEVPTLQEALEVEEEWKRRSDVPTYVYETLKAMPPNAMPMTLFSQAILAMQTTSIFTRKYDEGMKKDEQWIWMLEDSLNLTARLPAVAAYIYNLKHRGGQIPQPRSDLDYGANFASMMGVDAPLYAELMRLYFIIHSDHESGNVSAHATHMVGSTLADIYYATSAGMNGLAGPLHGRANQEALSWLLNAYEKIGHVLSPEELRRYAWETLASGQVIPGYGHAVLRKTDPRFTAQLEFGRKHFPEDPIFKLASMVYDVVPQVLVEQGKAKNPWPNVDAISGALQQHFGVSDADEHGGYGFYTVLFGVSRALGVSANAVWARALYQPLERPKSLTTRMLEDVAAKAGEKAKEV